MNFHVPFGRTALRFKLPLGMSGLEAVNHEARTITDLSAAVRHALDHPINTSPLRDLARPGDTACIVFTDTTRSTPDDLLVPALLEELKTAGVKARDITLLCGIGMHRPTTREEKAAILGREVVDRYRVIDNEPDRTEAIMDLGSSEEGIPLLVNRAAGQASILIATGIVEPHQYAGYSGGRKTLAIGAAGEATIAATHGPGMIDHPGVRLGRIAGNPFHEALTESARRAGLKFIVNVVLDGHKRPIAVMAGEPEKTFEALVETARGVYEVDIPRQFDVAVAGVGYPKDQNIYQACRAASYLFFAPTPVVREGGVIIVPAPTPEGVGKGTGERRFWETMKRAADMPSLLQELRQTGYPPGAQRAYIMAKVMEKTSVIVAGSKTPSEVRQTHMIPADDILEALETAAGIMGRRNLDVLVVPNALLTLPVVSL